MAQSCKPSPAPDSLAWCRARAVRTPRAVLEEFGTQLPPGAAVRVHDSTADCRSAASLSWPGALALTLCFRLMSAAYCLSDHFLCCRGWGCLGHRACRCPQRHALLCCTAACLCLAICTIYRSALQRCTWAGHDEAFEADPVSPAHEQNSYRSEQGQCTGTLCCP